jgi:glycosyltransferase involved in cell wall biosynthesis
MHVLFMAPDPVPHPKGAAQRIEATVRALALAGARVRVLTPAGPAGRVLDGVDHRTVALPQEGFLQRALAFREAAQELLTREPPDLVWFRSPWEGVPAVREAWRRGIPAVYEAHGFPSVELPAHHPGLRTREDTLERLVVEENMLLHGSGLLITPSRTGRLFLQRRGVPPERIRVVPNAVRLERFPAPAPPASALPLRLAYLGTLAPWQGLGTLVEALAHLKGRLEVRLRVVGTRKGAWLRDLRSLVRTLGVRGMLEVEGPLAPEQIPAFLAQSQVCLAPLPDDPRNSLQGCCPIKILEYLAAGRAVLATRVPPVEEILEHGRTAWLVRPGSPSALAEGLLTLAARPDLVEVLGRNARAEAEACWDRPRFEAAVAAVLGELRSSLRPQGRIALR